MNVPPDENDRGPSAQGTTVNDQHPTKDTEPYSFATVAQGVAQVLDLAAYRDLDSWVAAAEHLNACGMAAAVPESVMMPLRRRGLAVWPSASRSVA